MADMTPEQKAAAEKAAADAAAAAAATSGSDDSDDGDDAGAAGGDKDAEMARMKVALAKANKEAEARRKALKKYEDAEAERQKSEMNEADRLKADLEAARQEATTANQRALDTLIRAAFAVEAAKAGATHPEDVYVLADKSGVEVGEDGTVSGVAEAVDAMVKSGRVPVSEAQRLAPDLNGGAGSGDRSGTKGAKLTPDELEMARKMGVPPERAAAQKAAMLKETGV